MQCSIKIQQRRIEKIEQSNKCRSEVARSASVNCISRPCLKKADTVEVHQGDANFSPLLAVSLRGGMSTFRSK